MNDSFESMEQLLTHALGDGRVNYYAYALGRARCEPPSPAAANLGLQLIFTQGLKWIELIERFATNDYPLIYSLANNCLVVFPTLIATAHPTADAHRLDELEGKIFEALESQPTDIAWCAFVQQLKRRIEGEDSEKMVKLLERLVSTVERSPRFLEGVGQIQENRAEAALSSIYSITSYKPLLFIVRLYKACCKVYRKRLVYLRSALSFARLIHWISDRYTFLFNNFEAEMPRMQQARSQLRDDIIDCLVELRDFVELEVMAAAASERLVSFVLSWNALPNKPEDPEDQLNWEYGIIFRNYGDDLPSHVARATTSLAAALPGFLRAYLARISRLQLPLSEILMRMFIVHSDVNARQDLVVELLEPFLEQIMKTFQPNSQNESMQEQVQFCRKLRMFLLFAGVLKESMFKELIRATLEMLRREDYTSFCFVEGYNILHEINASSNKGKHHLERVAALARERIPDIVHELLNCIVHTYQSFPLTLVSERREGKLTKLLTLLQELLSHNERAFQGLAPDIFKKVSKWATDEATACWNRGTNTTTLLHKMVRMSKECITLMREDYFCDLEDSIYSLLELLKHHQSKDFQEDLLEMLAFVIGFEGRVSSLACTLLVSLERVVQQEKSLYSIINVIKAVCSERVASSVLDEWPDLIQYFLNLFVSFINDGTHGSTYRSHYNEEWEELIVLLGRFLQLYESYFEANEQIRTSLLLILQSMGWSELQLQLFIIMDHHRPVEPFAFFKLEALPSLNRRNSFRMLKLHYCDRLLRDYQEKTLNELLQIHRVELEKRDRRAFVSEVSVDWPCLKLPPGEYIRQTLKELKRRGKIDAMELSMFLRDFDLKY